MDPQEPVNGYYDYYAARSQPRPPQSPVPLAHFSATPPMASGPYASPAHPQLFSTVANNQVYPSPSESHYYSQHAARPTAGIYPYPEPAITSPQDAYNVVYNEYHNSRQPSSHFHDAYKPERHEEMVLNGVSSTRFASRHSRSASINSEDIKASSASSRQQHADQPPRDSISSDGGSLRHIFHHRSSSSTTTPSSSHGESHAWDQTTGSSIPHSVTATSATPSRRDFPIGADPHPSLMTWKKDPTELISSDETQYTSQHNVRHNTPAGLAPPCSLQDMREYFPLDTPLHNGLRIKLLEVMNSGWRRANEKEPDPQVLLQFTAKIEDNGFDKFRCLFFADGMECNKNIPRSDRMLEHLRRHVGVRPFTCDCNSEGCPGVFPSKSAMYQHQKNVEPVQCQRCGAQVLRQNLARHWRAQRCQRPDEDLNLADNY